jgi:hypothetical protein
MEIQGQQRRLDLPQFVRLAPAQAGSDLGPLAPLVGTWTGTRGWNLIAVPLPGRTEGFTLLVRPYYETITFTALGALVPDRGASEILNIFGVEYSLRVSDLVTNQPLHLENGMWLYTNDPQAPDSPTIVRQAVIPHGNSVLALGNSHENSGPPTFPVLDTFPVGNPDPLVLDYTAPYTFGPPTVPEPFNTHDANAVLRDAIKDQTILNTLTLSVSTQPPGGGGGIVNIPFIQQNANATNFSATFWIETVMDEAAGVQFDQLQYSQQTNLAFVKCGTQCSDEGDGRIVWPHVNVNTLVRQ